MNRRRLLTLIGLAPVAAPMAARAALAGESPLSPGRFRRVEFQTSGEFVTYDNGALHAAPGAPSDLDALLNAYPLERRLGGVRVSLDAPALGPDQHAGTSVPSALLQPSDAGFLLIDDVGSGP